MNRLTQSQFKPRCSFKSPRRKLATYGMACVTRTGLAFTIVNFAVAAMVFTFHQSSLVFVLCLIPSLLFFALGISCVTQLGTCRLIQIDSTQIKSSEVPHIEHHPLSRFLRWILKNQDFSIEVKDLDLSSLEPARDGVGLFVSTLNGNICTCSGIVEHREIGSEINRMPQYMSLFAHTKKYKKFKFAGTVLYSAPPNLALEIAEKISSITSTEVNNSTNQQPAVVEYGPGVIRYRESDHSDTISTF